MARMIDTRGPRRGKLSRVLAALEEQAPRYFNLLSRCYTVISSGGGRTDSDGSWLHLADRAVSAEVAVVAQTIVCFAVYELLGRPGRHTPRHSLRLRIASYHAYQARVSLGGTCDGRAELAAAAVPARWNSAV